MEIVHVHQLDHSNLNFVFSKLKYSPDFFLQQVKFTKLSYWTLGFGEIHQVVWPLHFAIHQAA